MRALLTGFVLLLTSIVAAEAASEMTFQLASPRACGENCPTAIVAQGRITQDSFRAFDALASRLPPHVPVLLNSNGGSFVGGILLGLALREHGSVVLVPRGAVCASACAYAFLGGVVREASPGSRIGVHRFFAVNRYTGQRALGYEHEVGPQAMALLNDYVQAMGVSPSLVALAARTEPSNIHFLSQKELRRYRVTTGARRR